MGGTVLLTRPRLDAEPWASHLQARGCRVVQLPLLDIRARALAAGSGQMLQQERWRAVLFVSANAVRHGLHHLHLPAATRIWSPGPGTLAALLAQGVARQHVDCPPPHAAQFDSEALWALVQGQIRPGDGVLILRGSSSSGGQASEAGHGRNWLGARLHAAGARVQFLAVYERARPVWTQAQQRIATHAARDGSVWLFSNSEALDHLPALVPDVPPGPHWGQARAVATHPRVAQRVALHGFGRVCACRPLPDELWASIESLG